MDSLNTQPVPVQVLALLATGQILGPSPKRVGLIFSAPPTNRLTISFGSLAVLDQGITLYPGQNPLQLWVKDFGRGLRQPIFAASAVADQTIVVTEILETA